MPGHLQCTGSDVFTQPCRHSLRGSGQRVTRTDLIREQLLRQGWAVLWWGKEARLELDFLASSFLTGPVAHKSMKATLSEEQVVATHCCFFIHHLSEKVWRWREARILTISFGCTYTLTLGIFHFSSSLLSFLSLTPCGDLWGCWGVAPPLLCVSG